MFYLMFHVKMMQINGQLFGSCLSPNPGSATDPQHLIVYTFLCLECYMQWVLAHILIFSPSENLLLTLTHSVTWMSIPWTHPQSFYPPPPGGSSEPPPGYHAFIVNCYIIWQHSKQQQIVNNTQFLCHNNVDTSSTIQLDKSPD